LFGSSRPAPHSGRLIKKSGCTKSTKEGTKDTKEKQINGSANQQIIHFQPIESSSRFSSCSFFVSFAPFFVLFVPFVVKKVLEVNNLYTL